MDKLAAFGAGVPPLCLPVFWDGRPLCPFAPQLAQKRGRKKHQKQRQQHGGDTAKDDTLALDGHLHQAEHENAYEPNQNLHFLSLFLSKNFFISWRNLSGALICSWGKAVMNMEWEVVSVIVVLLGLIASVSGPMLKLNSTLTKLTTKMDSFTTGMEQFQGRYKDHLKDQAEINKDHQSQLTDHEHRITVLEAKEHEDI
jgi:hypothetical protein